MKMAQPKAKRTPSFNIDPLQLYMSKIPKNRLLTIYEEKELALRIQNNADREAALLLAASNLRLVVKIALQFQRRWMQNLLDLIQEGNIGLLKAVEKFDPHKNIKFSYYASFWIKAYILKFIMDNWHLVKIGTTQNQRKLFFKLNKEKQKFIDEGFDSQPKLLSEKLGVSEQELLDMDQRLNGHDVSLNSGFRDDSDSERMDFISDGSQSLENLMAEQEIRTMLNKKISKFRTRLTKRELNIFDKRIYSDSPLTLQEIGDMFGVSRERVRQIEKKILREIRKFMEKEIPDFPAYAQAIQ